MVGQGGFGGGWGGGRDEGRKRRGIGQTQAAASVAAAAWEAKKTA